MEYKILYVEDQPDAETIKVLFKNYIDHELSRSLDEYTDQSIQSSAENMHNIENIVTDPFDETLSSVIKNLPVKTIDGYYEFFDQLPMVDFASGLLDKKDKSGKRRPGALSLLKKHATKYLVFIVDRDLFSGVTNDELQKLAKDEIEHIKNSKDIWPGFSGKKYDPMHYYSGDLLLEYLCLESRLSKKEILTRFRFLTGNAPDFENWGNNADHAQQDENLKNFLETLHFTTQEENGTKEKKGESDFIRLTVDKSSKNALGELVKLISKPVVFHIQNKHEDVFRALAENAEEYSIVHHEHVQNLIKALAYADGAKLNGVELKKPSVSLLRVLGEAFRKKVSNFAKTNYPAPIKLNFIDCQNQIKNYSEGVSPFFELSMNAIIGRYSDKKKQFLEGFMISQLNELELFSPPTDKYLWDDVAKNQIFKFNQKYRHIAICMNLVQTISSQEIHHNDNKQLPGKRLQLVTHALCEILNFYQKIFKEDRIEVIEQDGHRTRVLNVMEIVDKKRQGNDSWVPFAVIRSFDNYIGKQNLNQEYLVELGFDINDIDGKPHVKFLNSSDN